MGITHHTISYSQFLLQSIPTKVFASNPTGSKTVIIVLNVKSEESLEMIQDAVLNDLQAFIIEGEGMIVSEGPVDREMEIARQVAVNLHEFTSKDFIIALVTLEEGVVSSPSHLLIRLQEEGTVESVMNGMYQVVRRQVCDRIGCIVLYTSEHCFWCEVVKEQIQEILTGFGYSKDVMREVNVDRMRVDDITTLPTVDLCGERIIGFREKDDMASGILNAVVKSCFG